MKYQATPSPDPEAATVRPYTHRAQGVIVAGPGTILLEGPAVRALGRHLAVAREPDDMFTGGIVRAILRLSCVSRPVRDIFANLAERQQHLELNTAQAAELLGITTDGVRKRIARGQLVARHDGRCWRIDARTLEEHLE